MFCLMVDKDVTHIPKTDSGRVGGSPDGSGFKVLEGITFI